MSSSRTHSATNPSQSPLFRPATRTVSCTIQTLCAAFNLILTAPIAHDCLAEQVIKICYAGPLAQQRYRPRSWRRYHGASDFDLAADLGLRVCGSSKQATVFLRWLEIVTREMVQNNWFNIELVAKLLLEHDRLSGAEILSALRPHNPVPLKTEPIEQRAADTSGARDCAKPAQARTVSCGL